MANLDKFELEALAASAKRAKMYLDLAASELEESETALVEAKVNHEEALKRYAALEKYLDG